MTCIIGIEDNGVVYMGGDSMSSSGWDYSITAIKKVFKTGQFLIGYTDSFRMGQILQYHLSVRLREDGEDEHQYMVVAFVEAVRKLFKDFGFTWIENSREAGGEFLVGYNGKVYCVESDFQVNRSVDGVMACGCGERYALGALSALGHLPPPERINRALEITAKHSNGVSAPFHILSSS